VNWQELEQLLGREVKVFIDGKWQQGTLIGFGPGYTSDDIEITVMATTRFTDAGRNLIQKEHTFICKQNKLSSRLRRAADTERIEQ
jgi:hypothetical protein